MREIAEDLLVRPATPDDVPYIVALSRRTLQLHADALPEVFQAAGGDGITEALVHGWLTRADRVVLAAAMQGAFAGYAHAEVETQPESPIKRARTALHVHEMGVLPAFRGRGVGRALLAAVRTAASARAADEVSLDVYAFNAGAREMYERDGFRTLRMRMVAAVPAADPRADMMNR